MEQPNEDSNPIDLLFGGMEKLGPGDNADTLHVLRLLPKRDFRLVVDAGCGTGRQTLALAKELGVPVHALDSYQPFLDDLARRAKDDGVEPLVQVHRMDMKDIPNVFREIDLLWSEGAAYSIGFANALSTWSAALAPDGFLVVSELSWLTEHAPAAAREFFRTCYPDMRSVSENLATAESAGYKPLTTHTLPRKAWVEGFYDVLAGRAAALLDHAAGSVREFAAETLREIEVFEANEDSYGYVFYMLQRRT